MTKSTLQKRLDARFTESKSRKEYQIVKDLINGTNNTHAIEDNNLIRPCYATGSGRWTSVQNQTGYIISILNLLGLKYVTGNDAPRGGQLGNFIKITTKLI